MKKFILKEFKYEINKFSLMVEQYVSSDFKNIVEFYICGKSIWIGEYSNYIKAEQRFLTIKNIIRNLKIKFADLNPEEINSDKIKEISKEFLIEFRKIK